MDIYIKDFGNDVVLASKEMILDDVLIIPSGTYEIYEPIVIPTNCKVIGMGSETVLKPSSNMDFMMSLSGYASAVENVQLLNYAEYANSAVSLTSDFMSDIYNVYISGFNVGIIVDGSQAFSIRNSKMVSNDKNISIIEDGRNSSIYGCHIEGGDGISIEKTIHQAEGVRIFNNTILPSPLSEQSGGMGIEIKDGLEIQILNNIIDNCEKNGIEIFNGSFIKITNNWIGGLSGSLNSNGIVTHSPSNNISMCENTICGCGGAGINLVDSSETPSYHYNISGNRFLQNVNVDMVISKTQFVNVEKNVFSNPNYTILESSHESKCLAKGNYFSSQPIKSNGSTYKDNWGIDI